MARNDSIVATIASLAPFFFQRSADALEMSMTAWLLPVGMVAASRALRGISVCVACEMVEKLRSMVR